MLGLSEMITTLSTDALGTALSWGAYYALTEKKPYYKIRVKIR
jgi:hypothetical protein